MKKTNPEPQLSEPICKNCHCIKDAHYFDVDGNKRWCYRMGTEEFAPQTPDGKKKEQVGKLKEDLRSMLEWIDSDGNFIGYSEFVDEHFPDCAVLAASNPHTETETFNNMDSDASQIKFSKTLQSRFDLIFTIKDIPDAEKDAQIADKILKGGEIKYPIPLDLFKKYLFSARQINPDISDILLDMLKAQYLQLRNIPRNERVTPRDLSALKRLAQASARMRLSEAVEDEDIKTAIRIYGASLRAKRQE